VVIATGYCDRSAIPHFSSKLAPWIEQITPAEYRNPGQLSRKGVLIVGASSTGVQLAEEIQRSGRPVTLAVGRHTRLPRRYRGRDILWWLDQLGVLTQDASTVHDLSISRAQPSLQLVGRPDHATVDLMSLHDHGVRLVGRVVDVQRTRIGFADDLISTTAAADVKLATIRMRIDEHARCTGLDAEAAEPFVPTWSITRDAVSRLDLRWAGIDTVIWATGYRRAYRWLRAPVLDRRGEIIHHAGVTPYAGLYVLGLNFQRQRHSSFIDGVGGDAQYLAQHIAAAINPIRTRQSYA
jgi:putative flavoprotein involved in K+ transport